MKDNKHTGTSDFNRDWQLIEQQFEREKECQTEVDLKEQILSRINMEAYQKETKKPELLVRQTLWQRSGWKLGFAFVLGVFAGFLIFSFLKTGVSGGEDKTKEMKGTLYDSRSYDDMTPADNLVYDSPLAKAICAVRYSTKIVEIRVDLSSLYPVKATLQFDFNNFEVLNVQNVVVNDQTTSMAASNYIQINNVGDNKFIIQLYNKNSLQNNIDFKIFQNDMPIFQNTVAVNKE